MTQEQLPEFSEVNNTRKLKRRKLKNYSFFLAAFFIPFFVMALAYAIQGVYPIAGKHILTVDLYHQYAPFLRELRDKLIQGDSLFYTWSGGMGFNFYSIFTYYLASPFNLLLLLFKESQLSDAVLLITLFKIATSGLSFFIYASACKQKKMLFYVAISSAYALSGYSLAYSWNIMWLDTIILLPIVILGLEKIIRNESNILYILSLSLMLITNYYTAFFVCIFLIFYFAVLYIKIRDNHEIKDRFSNNIEALSSNKKKTGIKYFGKTTLRFIYSSLISAGISAITLIPTIHALLHTSASGDVFPESISFFEPFIDFFSRLMTLSTLSIRSGMPNIYIGAIIFLLLPVYFLNKRISVSTKISHGLLIFFLILSMNNNYLNFIWHGFHYPNQLPFRNSFIFVFLLCSMLIDSFNKWHPKMRFKWYMIMTIWIGLFLLLQKIDEELYKSEIIIFCALLLFIYSMIFVSGQKAKIGKNFISSLLCFVIIIEVSLNAIFGINSISENEYYGSRDGYKAGSYPETVSKMAKEIKDQEPLARVSLWPDKTVNDPMLYGFPGITIFASTYPKKPVQFYKKIGYDTNGINSYQNTGSNIILDSILGLKYKMINLNRDEQHSFYDKVREEQEVILYENKYALPLLYYVPSQVNNLFLSDSTSGLNNQKSLIQALGGNQDILRIVDPALSLGSGNEVTNTGNNKYSIKKESGHNGSRMISYDFTANESGYYTLSWESTGLKFDQVFFNRSKTDTSLNTDELIFEEQKQVLSRKDSSLSDLGYFAKNESARITFEFNEDSSDSATMQIEAAVIDQDLFLSFIKQLQLYTANPRYLKDNHLVAEIEAPIDGFALFTTTHDSSWKILVNGVQVEQKPLEDALILIPVKKGNNKIEMKFTPEGFTLGTIISCISIIIIVLTCFLKRKRKNLNEFSESQLTIKDN